MAKCIQCGQKAGLGMSLCSSCLVENARKQLTPEELSPTGQKQYEESIRAASILMSDAMVATSPRASVLAGRYRDAYLIAKVTAGLGITIKVVGFVLGGSIFLGGLLFAFLAAAQIGNRDLSGNVFTYSSISVFGVTLFVGIFWGFIVGFVFYFIGVIVSAQGQVLLATLDNTVGNSPFLEGEQKAAIMSLPV